MVHCRNYDVLYVGDEELEMVPLRKILHMEMWTLNLAGTV